MMTVAVLFAACGNSDSNGGGSVQFTASGELLAGDGYSFPPTPDGKFVDGWAVSFTKLVAVFDHVKLNEGANNAAAQAQVGKLVAEIDGPWAVDLHKGGSLMGKEITDHAMLVQTIVNQNKNGNAAFDPTQFYAFSFDSVPATAAAKTVNFDASDSDWQTMIQNGWNVLYVGTATWKGNAQGVTCTSSDTSAAGQAALASLPKTVNFKFGFKTPTSYVNCQNPDFMKGSSTFPGEDYKRGVQVAKNMATIAQVTFHTDHPFWESFMHDTPAHFDQLAALAKQTADGYVVTLEETKGVSYTGFKVASGAALPWRWCTWSGETSDQMYAPPTSNPQMAFDDTGITQPDYYSYMLWNQSTQGHLNADGICFVKRNY
jgi:hypothetical protein